MRFAVRFFKALQVDQSIFHSGLGGAEVNFSAGQHGNAWIGSRLSSSSQFYSLVFPKRVHTSKTVFPRLTLLYCSNPVFQAKHFRKLCKLNDEGRLPGSCGGLPGASSDGQLFRECLNRPPTPPSSHPLITTHIIAGQEISKCLNTKNQGCKKYSYATNQAKSFELWLKVSPAPCWLSYLTSVSKAYSQSLWR